LNCNLFKDIGRYFVAQRTSKGTARTTRRSQGTACRTTRKEIKMRHKFTEEDRRKGGWQRARQIAEQRANDPTVIEARAREACEKLGFKYIPEVECWTGDYPQFIDLVIVEPVLLAIEVNGGGYHWNGKMKPYDETKKAYLERLGFPYGHITRNSARTVEGCISTLKRLAKKVEK